MCGIAGFVNLEALEAERQRPLLEKMTRLLSHRGPDQEGLFFDDHAALGHRRLSIIDLSTGQQPMRDEEANLTLVFNGEIYNFRSLRQELKDLGQRFSTQSDTEVILKAYRVLGPRCVERLSGMFAFALWDGEKKRLLLARDRLGKKPLYYWTKGSFLAFASEIKSLLACGTPREINPEALDCYFCFGYIPSPLSIFKAVYKLPPATYAIFDHRGLQLTRYWQIVFDPKERNISEAIEEFEDLFSQAVKTRLISDVPLGAFLSGGIDSPLVVAKMQELLSTPVCTNAIGFDVPEQSELPLARKIAQILGTDHREFVVTPEIERILPTLAWHLDEPLADSSAVPTYYVCQMARQNVTVSLSGDGGDEGFGGYTFRYLPHLWECRLRKRLPLGLRSAIFYVLGELYPSSARLPKILRLKTIFKNLALSDAHAFFRDLVWLAPEIRKSLYTSSFMNTLAGFTPYEIVHPLYEEVKDLDPVSRCQYVDLNLYLPEDVLVKVDRMSMAVALEVRAPLLDHKILEFAATLPLALKISGRKGKLLLRKALKKRLPQDIVDQPKRGFAVPEAQWLRGKLRPLVEDILQDRSLSLWDYLSPTICRKLWEKHLSKSQNHGVFFWGLMMFALWERHYLHGGG